MPDTKPSREERQRRHPVWRTRKGAGAITLAEFSHWSDEEPPPDFPVRKKRKEEAQDPSGESGQ